MYDRNNPAYISFITTHIDQTNILVSLLNRHTKLDENITPKPPIENVIGFYMEIDCLSLSLSLSHTQRDRVSQNLCHKLFLGMPHPHLSKKVPINMGPKVNRYRDTDCRPCAGTRLSIT
jgi:hypothetical protein